MIKLKDIASKTGFSIATVSKALNHKAEISEKTAELIIKTAYSMGYSHRKPSRKETRVIGVILPEVRSHYYSNLMQSLNTQIEHHGYTMISMLTGRFSADVLSCIKKICQFDLDGLLVSCDKGLPKSSFEYLISTEVPTLLLTSSDLPYSIDSIYIKNDLGIYLALEHLVSLGHRKIGYLGEYMSDLRYQAFCNFLAENNIPLIPKFNKRGRERFERGGYLRALELLQEKDLPTAIVASYDQIAFGAMSAFYEYGLQVPDDISIVGYDNNIMCEYHPVPLTSITNPVKQMGAKAVEILLNSIRCPKTHVVQNVALQSRLVLRKSTRSIYL